MPVKKRPKTPQEKAHATGRWAEILFRALSNRVARRWRFVSFRGAGKAEWRGVVDLVAIRKDTSQPKREHLRRGDLFDLILVQVKGGSAASPTRQDCIRLREVAKYYHAKAVVQFQWQRGKPVLFTRLNRQLEWEPTTSRDLFEKKEKRGHPFEGGD